MFDICTSSIQNRQLPIIKEILLKFPFMLQLYQTLQDETFYQIFPKLHYKTLSKNQEMLLDSKSFYLFFQSGFVYKKGKQEKVEKTIRIKTKTKGFSNSRINKASKESKQNRGYEIQQFQYYWDGGHFSANNRCNQSYYCPDKKSLVLFCSLEQLPQSLVSKLKDIQLDKFKFIHSFPTFQCLQKTILQEYLYKFHFNLFTFNTSWHQQLNHQVLFIKEGSVEIVYNNGLFAPHVINGKCIIGLDESKGLSAKVISQKLVCFSISQQNIHTILSKSSLKKMQPLSEAHRFVNSGLFISPPNQSQQISQDNASMRISTSLKKRMFNRSQGQLDLLLKKERRVNLRKHFSNFYNQVFEQFSQKKVRHMGLDVNSDEKLVLYEIKLLQRKSPNMNEINNKLRKLRLQKMKRCKLAIQGCSHLKQLKNVGITIL